LRFESIEDGPGGAVLTIVVEDVGDTSPKQTERLKTAIRAEAEEKVCRLREALESERVSVLVLGTEVRRLEQMVDNLLSRPTFYLQEGDVIMGDKYNTGQAGAVGPHAHAHGMTFQQVGGNIESVTDLAELATELSALCLAMGREATETSHYKAIIAVAEAEQAAKANNSSKVAQSLKGVGKWALDIATKIGTSLATEAIKESMGMK
jgi:hypothetical protein